MELNSFCVIVSKHGQIIHWEPPLKLSATITKFRELCIKYGKQYNEPLMQVPIAFAIENPSHQGYSDKWIEDKIIQWKGNLTFVAPMVTSIAWSVQEADKTKIEVLHSSQT